MIMMKSIFMKSRQLLLLLFVGVCTAQFNSQLCDGSFQTDCDCGSNGVEVNFLPSNLISSRLHITLNINFVAKKNITLLEIL